MAAVSSFSSFLPCRRPFVSRPRALPVVVSLQHRQQKKQRLVSPISIISLPCCSCSSRLSFRTFTHRRAKLPPPSANVSCPVPAESDSSKEMGGSPQAEEIGEDDKPMSAISWGLVWSLMLKHKLRLLLSVISLIGCSTCTLSMPIYSGRFFEVLIGARPEPLWQLLSKVGVLYALEPIFTVIFVVNMNTIWEKVMSVLRAQIFRRALIQKVEFFDRHKVGELTGLLTSDLGSLKDVVSENVSRDRGFRALSEILGTLCILFALAPPLAPILGLLMLSISVLVAVYKRSTLSVFRSHGMVQASISDCVTETFSAIRTVRSFCGEKRQMEVFSRQVLAYQASGMKLGIFKSLNESVTRIAVYISLLALYSLGGSKVKAGELSVGTIASFIGYTFTLTFAVQGLVNTFGDLRGTFAAIDRINSIFSGVEIDDALAYGLEKEIQPENSHDEKFALYYMNGFDEKLMRPDHSSTHNTTI